MTFSRRAFITGLAGVVLSPAIAVANQAMQGYMGIGNNGFDDTISDGPGVFSAPGWGEELIDSKPAAAPPEVAKTYQPQEKQNYLPGEVPLRVLGTNEKYLFKFRDGLEYQPDMFESLNWFLRCRGDKNASTMMDYRLIEHLNYISHWFGNKIINIHSGYRTPAYNRKLKERNRKVAPNSYHMAGRAIDFSVEGISTRDACLVAILFRNLQGFGGIGYYPGDRFIHIDTGPVREWVS